MNIGEWSLRHALLGALLSALAAAGVGAQDQDMADVSIETVRVADGIYMLLGRGGNIGVSAGDDGVLLIDDQYAPLVPRILDAVAGITDAPVRMVLNTHWHGDHTGGNEPLAGAGRDDPRARQRARAHELPLFLEVLQLDGRAVAALRRCRSSRSRRV